MADEPKLPISNIGGNGFVWVLLVAAGTYFVVHQGPLEGSRPPAMKQLIIERGGAQDVDARLWQDPFATVADTLAKWPELTPKVCEDQPAKYRNHCRSPLDEFAKPPTPTAGTPSASEKPPVDGPSVLVASVSGAPYSEDHEFRLRVRYAVLAGLNAEGYVPDDPQHVGFYWPGAAATSRDSPSLVASRTSLAASTALPASSQVPQSLLPKVVPFEWFTRKLKGETSKILLLWFDEDVLGETPLKQYAELLCPSVPVSSRWAKVRILGPQSSTALEAMVQEVARDKKAAGAESLPSICRDKPGLQFYGYSATVNDATLMLAAGSLCKSDTCLADFFKNRIEFYRMVATDQALARTIRDELRLRRINADNVDQKRNSHVALVSEWDTFYGRALPESMARCLGELADCQADDVDPFLHKPWLHRFKYLRGMDGQMPNVDGTGSSSGATDKGGKADKASKDGTKSPAIPKASDRAEGQGQFDYLRRLGSQMQQLDANLLRDTGNGIAAIGVLGSDLYDKLLVLQALRPLLPNALFFTTDLDALLLHPSAVPTTRNLLVASSFGLQLEPDVQKEIPPFRSSYQTGAFLATRAAIRGSRPGWSMLPLLFEVGASREFQFASSGKDRSAKYGAQPDDPSECRNDLLKCREIQPLAAEMAPKVSMPAAVGLSVLGLLLLFGIPATRRRAWAGIDTFMEGSSSYAVMTWRFTTVLIGSGLVILAVAAAIYLLWPPVSAWLTHDGQPLASLEGISVWPTIFLRAATLLLCIWFIVRALRALDANIKKIADDMDLVETRRDVKAAQDNAVSKSSLWTRFVSEFGYRLPADDDATGGKGKEMPRRVFEFWRTYRYQGRSFARFVRVLTVLLVMAAFWWVLKSVFGYPAPPVRGDVSFYAYTLVTGALVLAAWFLILCVADATWLSWRIVKDFRGAKTLSRGDETTNRDDETDEHDVETDDRGARTSIWPPRSLKKYGNRLALPHTHSALDDWLDLVFVSKRTKCITRLIYAPFLIIALLVLSRSQLFANYAPSIPDLIVTGLALLTLCSCAVALRWSAEESRAKARRRLNEQLVAARKLKDGGRLAGQLEMLLRRVEELRDGAFSPFSQQPLVRGLLLPLGSLGGTALLEYLLVS
jgi:hypothetical protein